MQLGEVVQGPLAERLYFAVKAGAVLASSLFAVFLEVVFGLEVGTLDAGTGFLDQLSVIQLEWSCEQVLRGSPKVIAQLSNRYICPVDLAHPNLLLALPFRVVAEPSYGIVLVSG